MKHTPGKWEAGKAYKQDENQWYAVVFAPEKTDEFHSPRAAGALGVSKEEAGANARLIAAAPDLLAACEALNKAYQNGEDNDGSMRWGDVDHAWELAQDAVKSAKKETT